MKVQRYVSLWFCLLTGLSIFESGSASETVTLKTAQDALAQFRTSHRVSKLTEDLGKSLSTEDRKFLKTKLKNFGDQRFKVRTVAKGMWAFEVADSSFRFRLKNGAVEIAGLKNFYDPKKPLSSQWNKMKKRLLRQLSQKTASHLIIDRASATPVVLAIPMLVAGAVSIHSMLDWHDDCVSIRGWADRCEDTVGRRASDDIESLARFGMEFEAKTASRKFVSCDPMRKRLKGCLRVAYVQHRKRLNVRRPAPPLEAYLFGTPAGDQAQGVEGVR